MRKTTRVTITLDVEHDDRISQDDIAADLRKLLAYAQEPKPERIDDTGWWTERDAVRAVHTTDITPEWRG